MIRDQLAGKRIFITGTTGFLGTNLLERLLRSVPDCEIVLLVRAGKRSTVAQRVQREIFKNDAFDVLRAEHGKAGFKELTDRRVTSVAGDVSRDGLGLDEAGRAELASCDIVMHSAASVSFDSPLDSAVEINLLGPTRIAATLQDLGVTPHLVAVSTCYVAGNRRGSAPEVHVSESPFFVDVDWRGEVDGARRARTDAEDRSRRPDKLAEFRAEARDELGAAGGPLLADKTEQQRKRWVSDQMVQAGLSRSASLGWPDAYTYTKALGERALLETRGDIPVSIVRPSIIESALLEPKPGWIRGFRMAEPVILSYARGQLSEFPGVPEGIIDVIPVDLVTAAIIGVAARGPNYVDGVETPDVIQVASGSVNPLRYRQMVNNIREWFTARPIYDNKGQPILLPEFGFPGRGRVDKQLARAKKTLDLGEKALHALPLRGRQAEWGATLDEKRSEYERAAGYVALYGKYAECEALYGVERLLELQAAMDEPDRVTFNVDPRAVDWDRYIHDVHLPSIVDHARVRMTPGGRQVESREDRLRRQVLAPERQLAAFDLENTLIASNVVASYSWLATRRLPPDERLKFIVKALREGPSWLAQDRADRTDFLRFFYRNYNHASVAQIEEDSVEMFTQLILAKSFPAAIRRVREHKRLGHRTVLITGALDFVVKPLIPLFDDIVATEMSVKDGAYTGELLTVPPTGETRAQVLMDYAEKHGCDLAESVAYADSSSDLPMLDIVGFPVAVNPEVRLAALARKRGWLVEDFRKADGAPRKLLPIGSMRRRFGGGLANPMIPRENRMKALVFERNLPRFGAAMVAGSVRPGSGAKVGPLRLADIDPPALPGPDWVYVKPRLAGVCGSDLASIDGSSSRYFEPIVSFPFTMGHEVVADLIDPANGVTAADGNHRVVIEPVLGCVTRNISPPCAACAAGDLGNCTNIAFGDLLPGLQSGFCCDTGGGWSTMMVAHRSQLHAVPGAMSDEAAVMVEPTACAVHGALSVGGEIDGPIVVLGAGTLGLLTVAALRHFRPDAEIVAVAKHAVQRSLARDLGADHLVEPAEIRRGVRRLTGSMALGGGEILRLTGGASVVFDCVGSAGSITDALSITRPRGTVVMVGMPGSVEVDLTGLWHKEIALVGAYAYGTEKALTAEPGTPDRRTFDLAFELVQAAGLDRLVTATYPLARFEDAIVHASNAGGRGAVKIAFDLRTEKERTRL